MPKHNGSIRLSPKYGVNPAIPLCFLCQKPKNEVILAGRIGIQDTEAPHAAVWNHEPCDECKTWQQQGVIFISVRDGEQGDNPYRTGGWAVLKDEAVRRFINNDNLCTTILKKRVAFVPDQAWDMIGLPRHV